MKSSEFTEKTEHLVMERGPLAISHIVKATGYRGERPGRILSKSKNLYFMGNTHSGIWYLEHQLLEARDNYSALRKEYDKRKEERRHEVLNIPVNPNIHSLLSIFKTNEDAYTARQVWGLVGRNLIDVRRHLTSLENDGMLFADGRPRVFRRNPALAEIFGDAAEEIFKDYFK